MLTFRFSGAEGKMTEEEILTAGMAGKEIMLEFTPEWDGLSKTVVFSNGDITRDVLHTGGTVVIPRAILGKPLKILTVGVYGVSADGERVIPTLRAEGPKILPGVCPAEDPSTDPALPVWQQLFTMIAAMGALAPEEETRMADSISTSVMTGGATLTATGAGDTLVIATSLCVGDEEDTVNMGGVS